MHLTKVAQIFSGSMQLNEQIFTQVIMMRNWIGTLWWLAEFYIVLVLQNLTLMVT